MNLLLITASYPPVLGGLQTVAHQVARHMHQRGHAVYVLTMRYPRYLAHREIRDGIPVERLFFIRPSLCDLRRKRLDIFLAACFYYPFTIRRLATIARTFQPQVVNLHFPTHPTPFVLHLRKRQHFRLVVSLHGHDVLGDRQRSDYEREQLRQVLRQADAITTCSEALLRAAIAVEPGIADRASVHYNGVDLSRFADSTIFPHPRPYLLFVGRLSYAKGVDLLLEAFAQVAAHHPDVDLLIAGDGEARAQLETLTTAHALSSRVHFLGRASPLQVVQLLNGCLFAVFPSRIELFGIVAVEAMAAGKAVLATQVGGFPEVLPVPPNALVPPCVEAIAAVLDDWLMRREEISLGGQQNRVHAQRFEQGAMLRQFEATLIGTPQ